ncbi:MAG: DoxX family protein [Vulcanimicrobiaceae bacterium]
MNLPSPWRYGFWLAIARVATGVIWLGHGVPKFRHSEQFMPPAGFIVQYIAQAVAGQTGPYHDFLVNFVQPNIGIVAELVRLGEVLVGCSLVFGLLTRLGALGGVFLTLNYIAAHGMGTFGSWTGLDGTTLVLTGLFLVLPAGRVLGVDALLGRRSRRVVAPAAAPPGGAPTSPSARVEFVEEPPMAGPTAPKS